MEQEQREDVRCVPAGLPPATLLARHLFDVKTSSSAVAVVKDSDLKMYHVMSAKQSLFAAGKMIFLKKQNTPPPKKKIDRVLTQKIILGQF